MEINAKIMEINDCVQSLAALAQDTRLTIYRTIVRAGPDGIAVGAIRTELGIAPATLSFHLNRLSTAGLIERQRRGRHHLYRADFVRMQAVIDYLVRDCCGGQPDKCLPCWPQTGEGS